MSVVTVKVKKAMMTLMKLMIQSTTQLTWIHAYIDSQNQHVQHLEYTFVPGEDKQPIFHEPLAEYLLFPTFFVERSKHPIMRGQGKFISQIFSSMNYVVLIQEFLRISLISL